MFGRIDRRVYPKMLSEISPRHALRKYRLQSHPDAMLFIQDSKRTRKLWQQSGNYAKTDSTHIVFGIQNIVQGKI